MSLPMKILVSGTPACVSMPATNAVDSHDCQEIRRCDIILRQGGRLPVAEDEAERQRGFWRAPGVSPQCHNTVWTRRGDVQGEEATTRPSALDWPGCRPVRRRGHQHDGLFWAKSLRRGWCLPFASRPGTRRRAAEGESDKTRSVSGQRGVGRRSMYISTQRRGDKAAVVLERRELNWFFHNDIRTMRNTISIAWPIFHGGGLADWRANGVQVLISEKRRRDGEGADDSQRRLSCVGAKHYRW
jgi:hypothetical protein